MKANLWLFVRDETAATAVEYGLMLACIFLVFVVGARTFGAELLALWNDNSSTMSEAFNR